MRNVATATTRSGTRTTVTTIVMRGSAVNVNASVTGNASAEAKTTGVVVGVVGAAVVAGVIAAAAKRERETRERADYCIRRYGNYDRRNDTYRGADGYTYPCR